MYSRAVLAERRSVDDASPSTGIRDKRVYPRRLRSHGGHSHLLTYLLSRAGYFSKNDFRTSHKLQAPQGLLMTYVGRWDRWFFSIYFCQSLAGQSLAVYIHILQAVTTPDHLIRFKKDYKKTRCAPLRQKSRNSPMIGKRYGEIEYSSLSIPMWLQEKLLNISCRNWGSW